MVATKALGLGIDDPTVRAVFHFKFPTDVRGWAQEQGRAGRSGNALQKESHCVLVYHPRLSLGALAATADLGEGSSAHGSVRVALDFLQGTECRRRVLLRALGERPDRLEGLTCAGCDVCYPGRFPWTTRPTSLTDMTPAALGFLRAVERAQADGDPRTLIYLLDEKDLLDGPDHSWHLERAEVHALLTALLATRVLRLEERTTRHGSKTAVLANAAEALAVKERIRPVAVPRFVRED